MTEPIVTTGVNDLAIELAVLKAVGDHVKRLTAERKKRLAEAIKRGTVYARVDEEDLATVVVVVPHTAYDVVDRKAFIEWVRKNRPTAIVEEVRASDEADILAAIIKTGDLPGGVEPTTVAGYVSVKQTPGQVEALFKASTEGRLASINEVLELGS